MLRQVREEVAILVQLPKMTPVGHNKKCERDLALVRAIKCVYAQFCTSHCL